jgi:hypothetical protein
MRVSVNMGSTDDASGGRPACCRCRCRSRVGLLRRSIRSSISRAEMTSYIEGIIDADPVAALVRDIMAERSSWTGSAADLLRAGADLSSEGISRGRGDWPTNPRALAGRLRRAQTFLRTLGIEVTFSRGGRAGTRMISMRTGGEYTVSTVSSLHDRGSRSGPKQFPPVGWASITALDDTDGADDNAAFCGPSGRKWPYHGTPW